MVAADYAQDKLDHGDGDASVCANYEKDLIKSREKKAAGKADEKKDRRWKRVLPLWDDEE